MQGLPHHYRVKSTGGVAGDVALTADRLATIQSASPAEYDGPGDRWSPETLLVGAVADCFLLTFRAVAKASKLSWTSLECEVTGTLDRLDGVTQFTHFDLTARLVVSSPGDDALARRALEKAERNCLITNSLKASVALDASVDVGSIDLLSC